MNLINENVYHSIYGKGIIIDEKENKIKVNFGEAVGTKTFLYPEAFERFLKPVNSEVEEEIVADLHKRQAELEQQRLEKEQREAESKALQASIEGPKKRTSSARKKK